MTTTPVSYRALLSSLAEQADQGPVEDRQWIRDSEIDLRTQTYQDWTGHSSTPTKIEGLTPLIAQEILADICRASGIPLEDLTLVPRITFGCKQCIYTGTEPMWSRGFEFRAGSLALKWDTLSYGATTKGRAFRALAECAARTPSSRSWVGSLRELLELPVKAS